MTQTENNLQNALQKKHYLTKFTDLLGLVVHFLKFDAI